MPYSMAISTRRIFPAMSALAGVAAAVLILSIYYVLGSWLYFHNHQRQGSYSGDFFIQDDRELGYSTRPGITLQHTASPFFEIYTDDIGARAAGKDVSAAPQTDVLGSGDSYMWGYGVQDQDTFLKILGRGKKLGVLNLAVPDYGIPSMLLRLKRFLYLKPKVIVFSLIENDIDRSLQPCAPTWSPYCLSVPFVDFDESQNAFIRPPAETRPEHYIYMREVLMNHSFGPRDIAWAVKRDFLRLTKKDQDSTNAFFKYRQNGPLKEKALDFLFQKIAGLCREASAKLIIVYIPVSNDIQPPSEELASAIRKYTDSRNVFYADMTGKFQDYAKLHGEKTLMAGGVDVHPGEAAHRLIANEISALIDTLHKK